MWGCQGNSVGECFHGYADAQLCSSVAVSKRIKIRNNLQGGSVNIAVSVQERRVSAAEAHGCVWRADPATLIFIHLSLPVLTSTLSKLTAAAAAWISVSTLRFTVVCMSFEGQKSTSGLPPADKSLFRSAATLIFYHRLNKNRSRFPLRFPREEKRSLSAKLSRKKGT